MNENPSTKIPKTQEELDALFEKHWATFPVFPIPEEHARHKIAAHSAFYSGFLEGIKTLL